LEEELEELLELDALDDGREFDSGVLLELPPPHDVKIKITNPKKINLFIVPLKFWGG
tara:strand:+ start:671 stop:841 length:171 start_codon:yes stop_codon:yes gene_type:complete